jgi:hypothetical protein
VPTNEPEVLIDNKVGMQVVQIRPKVKPIMTQKEREAENNKSYIDTKPKEVISLATEPTLVNNFEVDFSQELEVMYSGGIKGIKALRVQRDLLNKL